MIKAVIFDMDGLMFDTEALAKQAWRAVGLEMNLPAPNELVYKVIGMNAAQVRKTCLGHFGPTFDYDGFRKKTADYMHRILKESGVPIKQGLPELLGYIKENGHKTAVASSSSRATVEYYLETAQLAEHFPILLCGDMVKNSKPAPDIFLAVANALDTQPADCLVLEDSHNGIRAAHAAGMPALMVPDLVAPTDELRTLCSGVFESLYDVIPFLEKDRAENK